jgi:phosphatidylserine/phosphatidylglycerophosphate/cardiolipin synthase-like enzyme
MKRSVYIGLVIVLASVAGLFGQTSAVHVREPAASEAGISVYFSPRGGCTDAVVQQINDAKTSIHIQVFSFTSVRIAQATAAAHKRGVKVIALMDARQCGNKYCSATFLFNQGIETYIDTKHASAHDKVMLIDGEVLITGSFNFSTSAEDTNAENLLIMTGKPKLYEAYERNFQEHLEHGTRYQGIRAKSESAAPDVSESPDSPEAAETSDKTPPADAANTMVYVTKSGSKYHLASCRFVSKGGIAISLAEAKAKGMTACSSCDPPE